MGITEPEDLRSDVRGVEVQPGDAADLRPIQPIERADLCRGSPVEPDDRGKERLAVRVDRDKPVDLGRQSECSDVARRDGALAEQGTDDVPQGRSPIGDVLLCPAGMRVLDLVGRGSLRDDRARRVKQHALQAL